MKNERFYSNPTQVYWTCKKFLDGHAISHKTEIREVRGWRLGAIVHNLKRNYGWPIEVEYRGPENVAYYWLRPGTDTTQLKFPRSAKGLAGKGGAQ